MSVARQPSPLPPGSTLDPALLRIVEAMARAQAERDFRAALLPTTPR